MRKRFFIFALVLIVPAAALAQSPAGNPQVRVNYLNVCSPAEPERQLIAGALERIPVHPKFVEDFEVARGRSTLGAADLKLRELESTTPGGANSPPPANGLAGGPDKAASAGAQGSNGPDRKSTSAGQAGAAASQWIRIRREFPESSPFANVQYSFSMSQGEVGETLTLRARDARDIMQVSISTSSSTGNPAQVARLNTPAARIRLERFGRSSVVLARCPAADQARFEPLFGRASALLAAYRGALQVATVVPAEIARLPKARPGRPPARPDGHGR